MAKELTTDARRALMGKTISNAKAVILDSPMMLARQGIDPEKFADIMREAIISNPDIIMCTEASLARAVRKCCRDGIVPDGHQGAIIPFGDEAAALTMVHGYKRMAYEALGAEMREGAVYDGDHILIKQGVGITPTVEIDIDGTDFFSKNQDAPVVGAYLWMRLPHEDTPRLYLYRLRDITRARDASRAKKGPWVVWPDRMAVKSLVNSAIRSLSYLRDAKSEALFRAVYEDSEVEYGAVTIDAEAVPIGEGGESGTIDPKAEPAEPAKEEAQPARRRRGRPPGSKNRKTGEDAGAAPAAPAAEPATEPAAEKEPETAEATAQPAGEADPAAEPAAAEAKTEAKDPLDIPPELDRRNQQQQAEAPRGTEPAAPAAEPGEQGALAGDDWTGGESFLPGGGDPTSL